MKRFLICCFAALAALVAKAEEPFAAFVRVESGESAAVRLECRDRESVAARVVTGTVSMISPSGATARAWDTANTANGWHEIASDGNNASLLVVNPPDYKVEGGRLQSSTIWTAEAVHWVRNWVIVPNGVTLTVKQGTVVKFGEQTGIKVEDGGAVDFQGKSDSRIVLTHFADDVYGGDSDFGATNAWYGAWSVTATSGGTISDVYTHVRYGTVGTLPTVAMPASVTAQRIEGKARIPVSFSGTRANRFSLHWETVDGTAKYGVDFSEKNGEAVWANTSETTGYFEIPLIKTADDDEVKTFRVQLVSVEDANPNPSRIETTVTIISGTSVPIAVSAESGDSATIRMENRATEMVGRALVRGVEWKASTPDTSAVAWDTTKEPEGWQTLTAGGSSAKVLVRNDSKVTFEGGRLTGSVKWDNSAVHVVRNQVIVPSGVKLTIGEGTVVKFAEVTGIKIEDGGSVSIEGKSDARAVLTSLADDAFGGDTDLIKTNGVYGSWSIATVGSGSVSDVYTYVRYGTIPSLPTLTMPASATAQRSEGKVRIPITLSGTRSNRMAIHWRTHDGTAKHGVDFTETEGETTWSNTSSTTVYLEIPLITESDADGVKTFVVEVVSAEDVNLDPTRLVTKVTIVTGSLVPIPTCAVSESSEATRLEARTEGMVGKAAVVSTEWKAADGESRAKEWDTTPLGYGWQTLDDGHDTNAQVLALNDAKIAVEGGRLTANATWNSNVVHVVRNTVIVPNGVTLSVTTNAVAKFCENTGIKVEEGGSLIVVGSTNEPAVFTVVTDDEVGGDTDKRTILASNDLYSITVISGGTFTDQNAAFRHVVMSSHATLSLPTGCEINESEKQVQIPVSVSGSRSTPFRVFWRAIDDTAKYPDDYPAREGVVEWNSTSDGTKYITVPVNDDGEEEETERFKVELYDAQGANISRTAFVCTVTVRDSTAALVPVAVAAESEASAAVRLENRPEGTLGKAVAHGVEFKAAGGTTPAVAWDTTKEDEGWQALTATDDPAATANVLVRNDPKVAVEGGRLETTTVWDSNTVHLVRNMVIVPSGVTLSVTTNAVVKFCENTGVKVEAGGRFQLLGSLDENVYMTLANDDTVGGDTDKDEEREWVDGAATYSVTVVSGGTFTDMNSVIRGTTIGTFGSASVNAKTVVDASEGVIRIPVFVNGSRTTQFSVDWKTSDGHHGQLVWGNINEGTKWVTLNVADCSEKFTFELCECRGINIDGTARASEVSVFRNTTPLAVSAESESSAAVRFENRADGTIGKALCFGTELKSADGESRAEAWDTTQEANDWIDLGEGMKLLVRNDADLAVEGGRLMPTYEVVNTNGVDVTNWNYAVNWTSDKVHVVRNWVIVPNGMTLTIAAGTVVKFAEFTGFKVEAGGRLYVEGTVDAPVVYTAAADDTIGGDTDKREVEPQYGDYSINIISGGTYSDRNCAVRYATFSNLGTATLPARAVASEKDGVVRVPMFISTSRTTAFCVDWRVASGTYATKGRLNWNTYSEGTKYIEIPLTPGTVKGEFDTFEIEMYESQGINVSTTERKCVVTIYPDKTFPEEIAFADSAGSAAVRMENRDPLWSYGAEIVCGTELKSANGESRAEPWDTTQENEGWVEVNDGAEKLQLLVRNDESVAVEGGRLNESMTWGKDKVHIVRNWVVVPNGITLTIAAGTVVKFCDETGIKVEAGGRLVSAGTSAADVILTSINDDTVGGDTDLDDEAEPSPGDYRINVISGGTFTDTYTQMRYGESGTFGSVSIASDVVAKKDGGIVRIPVTISSSRSTPFSVDWVAHDGTAIYGEDYLCASGRIDWTSSSQGMKYLEIPLDRLSPTAEDEWFEVELITGLGINLNLNSTLCIVDLYDSREALVGDNEGYAESAWSEFAAMDSDAGREPKFVIEDETLTYSTDWATNGAVSVVAITDAENNAKVLHDADAPAEGAFVWSPEGYEDGRYDLTHRITDDEGRAIKTDYVMFIINRDVMTHGGRLTADETWGADKVHLVKATVYVPYGVTLTIAPDAIVKFMPGTEIVVEAGGLGICRGAIITHAYDDAMGGDTFFDGGDTIPSDGAYKLTGDWEDDETTQYHYVAPIEVGGTIRESQRWPGYKTYKVKSSITLQSGVTLDIEPGAVIKFGNGMSFTVNSGATLNAQGTRSAPIVFTSIKDDDFGGDTNGDGGASTPQPGDWREVIVYGTVKANHLVVSYGAGGGNSELVDAIKIYSGGNVTMENSVLSHFQRYAICDEGGTSHFVNCAVYDAYMAFRHGSGYKDIFDNCVIYDCSYLSNNGGQVFRNCVIGGITTDWQWGTQYGLCRYVNCMLWNDESYGPQNLPSMQSGSSSTLWADPKFEDVERGDFRLRSDSPCIDAGNGAFASSRDFCNQPRRNVATVTPTGVADDEGNYPDIGLYEVQPRFATSDIDLAMKTVSVPAAMSVGDVVEVSWRVSNLGTVNAEGPWSDKVEIISGSGEVTLLGTYLVKGGIAAGGERLVSSSFRVPSAAEGECRIRVTTNYARDLYEGSQTANNVMYADVNPVISIPTAEMSAGEAARLRLIPGQSASYALDGIPAEGGAIALRLAEGVSCEALVSFGKLPTSYAHASAMTVLPDGRILISIPPNANGETVYLSLIADEGVTNTGVIAELLEEYPAIYSVSKVVMPNIGKQSLTIYGVGLDSIEKVALVATDGAEIVNVSARAADACELSATFALAGARTGTYRVAVTSKDGIVATSTPVISIYPSESGEPNFKVTVEGPEAIRSSRWYELAILVENTGNADGTSPIISVNGHNLTFKDPDGSQTEYESVIHLLGTSEQGDPLVIGAGEIVRIPVMFKQSATASDGGTVVANAISREDVHWGVFINKGNMPDEEWDAFSTAYKEGFVDAGAFLDAVYAKAALVASVGKPPVCAQRLYDFVQREKRGETLGVVAGVVLDADGAVKSGQQFTIGALGSASPCVGVSADSYGMFVQYAVPTGLLVAVSDTGIITFEGDCELENEPVNDCVLTWHEGNDEEPEEMQISHGRISRLMKLPVMHDSWLWMDGAALKGGIPGSASETALFDSGVGSYRVCAISESECLLVFTLPVDGTNALFACKLRIASTDSQPAIGTSLLIAENVHAFHALSKPLDGTFRILYSDTDADTGVHRCYAHTLSDEEIPNAEAPDRMSKRSVLLAAGTVDYDEDVFPSVKIGPFESPVKIGVWFEPLKDTGLKETGCCIWQRETTDKWMLGGSGGKFKGATPGVSISGKTTTQDTYWCQKRKFGFGDCSDEKKSMHSSSRKASGKATVTCEMGLGELFGKEYSNTFPDMLNIKENFYSRWGLELSASAKGSLTFVRDYTVGFVTYPCKGEIITKDIDRNTYGIRGALSISGDVKLSGHHMFSAKNPIANLTDSIGVELPSKACLSGEIWLEYHHDWDKTGGNRYHSNTASYGGKIAVLPFFELSGSKQWRNGKWTGQWKRQWRVNPLGDWKEKDKYGDTGFLPWTKLDSSSPRYALLLEGRTKANSLEMPELATDILVDDGLALLVKSVHPCDMGAMGDSIVCREYARDGGIWVGVFAYLNGKAAGRLNEDDENVASVKVLKSSDGLIRVFYTAALPQLVKDDEDATFQSCIVRSLYCRTYTNGTWKRRVKIAGGGNASVDDFTISQPDGNGTVGLLWREDKVTGSNGVEDNTLHCATIEAFGTAEATHYGCVVDMSDGTVGASNIRVENGLPILDYAKHVDDSDDVLHTLVYNSTSQCWVDNEVMGVRFAKDDREPIPLNVSGVQNKFANEAKSAMRPVATPMMKSSGWTITDGCDRGCNCGCGEYRETPPPGCICKGSCNQCRQDCGSYCYCGYKKPFTVPQSSDPNEMAGPEGKGNARCVRDGDWMNYTIYFENKAEATAAAQDVFVTLPKDPELDWTTFELSEIVFGDNIDTGLASKAQGTSNCALPGTTWSVRTIVTHTDEAVKWHLRVVDPSTPDNYPSDPYAGFLPPNDETGRGEGHLGYRVKVKKGATVGSTIRASATIVFDTNDPIETDPAWWNTVGQVHGVKIVVGGVETELELFAGTVYGTLPDPGVGPAGCAFGGWYTGPNGTGVKIEPTSVVDKDVTRLHQYWIRQKFTAHFEPNGADGGEMADQTFDYGVETALRSNAFALAGHTFAGWATNETAAVKYADGEVVSNLTEVADGIVNLYATWTANVYRVSFDAKGGLVSPTDKAVSYGEPYGALPMPTWTGHTFGGWQDAGGQPVTDKTVCATTGDVVVYANWTANEYTVSFDANGGAGEMADMPFVYGVAQTLPDSAFAKPDCDFLGWARDAAAVQPEFFAGTAVSNLTANAGERMPLFAIWREKDKVTLTITINGVATNISFVIGKPFGELPDPGTPPVGHSFGGWYSGPNGQGARIDPMTIVPADGIGLCQYWMPNAYTVHFEPNGADGGKMEDQAFAYGVAQALAGNQFVLAGHTFAGWATNETATATYADGEVVSNLTAEADGVVNLYATWTEIRGGTVAFAADALTVDEGGTLRIAVLGGDAELASGVQVQATYNTAAAADLDLKNATTNGAAAKSFKFPVTLTWAAGEVGEKTVEIPVLSDKAVEADEFLTLELLNPMNVEIGETAACTVTIHDPKLDELKAAVAAGTATKAQSNDLQKVEKALAGKAYVRGLANDATRGKVTGSALAAEGKTVTLKAAANKGWVFAGWYTDPACTVGHELTGYGDYRNPSLAYVNTNGAVTVFARFIPPEEDSLSLGEDFLPAEFAPGADCQIVVPVKSVSYPTVKVTGLPSGMKFADKDTLVKATKTTSAYTIPANTIYGAPTKASSKPVTVTVTVKNLGGYQITRKYEIAVAEGMSPEETKAKVVSDAAPYHAVAARPGDDYAGKVTGAGVYQAGKKVTLKATANKGYVFNGWYDGESMVTQATSFDFAMPSNDLAYVARFVTAEEDKASVTAGVDGTALAGGAALATNVMCGVALRWPVAVSALSQPTVAVSGLPSGLKFTAKDILKKGSKTEVDVPANTIYGAPTAASKVDAKTGAVTPSKVKVTVTTAGKSKAEYVVELTVDPLPAWAVGEFSGLAETPEGRLGGASMTVTAAGKASGKVTVNGTNCTFSADSYGLASRTVGETNLVVAAEGKVGKDAATAEVTVTAAGAAGAFGGAKLAIFRNVWKDKGADPVPAEAQGLYTAKLGAGERGTGHLSLTVGKDGAVKAAGKAPDGTALSATATLMRGAGDGGARYFIDLFAAPSAYKGGYVAGRLDWDAAGAVTAPQGLRWRNLNPESTADYYAYGFDRVLSAAGAWYSKTEPLTNHYHTLAFEAENAEGAARQACWDNLTVSVDAAGKKFVVDQKATKPTQDKATKAWSYEGGNDAALTFAFTPATGIWSGSFLWWFDAPKHASTKVPFEGVMVQGEDLEGFGTYDTSATYVPYDKKGNPQKEKSDKFKESDPVSFRGE